MNTDTRNYLILTGVGASLALGAIVAGAQSPALSHRSFSPSSRSLFSRSGSTPTLPTTDGESAGKEDGEEGKTTSPALKFDNADALFLMEAYANELGRTLLISPDTPKVQGINLRSQKGVPLSREEYLEAIEVTLSMNGIVLEPFGEKFLKVLPRKTIRAEGIKIMMEKPEGGHPEKNKVISQMIQLKALTIDEAQKALEGFKRPDGLIQSFERTNSLLVTDTQENINRMLEIVKFIDQPLVATEEVNVRVIRFAKAEEIKTRLEEIVNESMKENQQRNKIEPKSSGSPGMTRHSTYIRYMRPGSRTPQPPPAPTPNKNISTMVSDADRGMIRGKVQVIADERSNQLIIITRKENMDFFDKIITVLDVETDPDVKVEVRRLKFAVAEDVSSMLNDLIGNASSKKDDKNNPNAKANQGKGPGKSTSLADAVKARTAPKKSAPGTPGETKIGKLSKDNITILADERTNAIVMMGSPSDLKAINEIISGMDIQLSQVMIETVVLQVELGDDLKTGIDWVKRGKHTEYKYVDVRDKKGIPMKDADGNPIRELKRFVTRDTIFNNGDQMGGGGGTGSSLLGGLLGLDKKDGVTPGGGSSNNKPEGDGTGGETGGDNIASKALSAATETAGNLLGAKAGLSYFLKSDKLNIAALIEASKSDSRTKVLSSPVLMTVDNKEATIEATSMRYLYKGVRYSGSSYNGTEVPDYEQRDIGLTVTITPRINPNGTVVLSIEEKFETVGANQTVGSESYPTVNTRKLQADVSVENMQTVVLGGLVQNEIKTEETGIPILKDIPWIGKYLFGSTSYADSRSELLVFLTPYVLDNSEDLSAEAARRKAALSDPSPWIDYGWSRSKLADPVSYKEKMRRTRQRWNRDDDEHKAQRLYEKALKAREKQLRERAEEEAEEDAEAAAKEAEESAEAVAKEAGAKEGKKSSVSKIKDSGETGMIKVAGGSGPKADNPAKAPESEKIEPLLLVEPEKGRKDEKRP